MTLVRKELIAPGRSDFPGDDGFRFAHGLVRDAAYRAISKGSRADLHERFAEWLEEKAAERRSEYELILGYHLERAYRYRVELGPIGDRERELARRAAEFLAAGGRRALRRGDLPATVKLLDHALSLLPEEGRARLELLLELGFTLFAAGSELERSDAMLAEAIQLARDLEDRRLEWRAVVLRSHVQTSAEPERRDVEDVLREALEATAVFEQEGDDIGLARACFLLVDAWWMKGEAAKAAEAAERALGSAVAPAVTETWRRASSCSAGCCSTGRRRSSKDSVGARNSSSALREIVGARRRCSPGAPSTKPCWGASPRRASRLREREPSLVTFA